MGDDLRRRIEDNQKIWLDTADSCEKLINKNLLKLYSAVEELMETRLSLYETLYRYSLN